MKLILHIGTEKTGTTTTQGWLADNREALANQGIFYSKVLGTGCHVKLHLWCLTPGRHDESFQRVKLTSDADRRAFRAELPGEFAVEVSEAKNAGCHTFLISNELCHSRLTSREEVQRVREFLKPHFDDIELICALRPQIDLAVSHASNLTKAAQRVTKAFFDRVEPDSKYFNYRDFVELWSMVFPPETLRLVPIRRTPDFTAVLAEHAGINVTNLQPPVRVNEALDVRVIAMINAMKTAQVSERRSAEPLAFIPRDVLKQLPYQQRLQPGLEIARSVQARFDESNRALTDGRTDVEFSDLEPDWSRYEGPGNLDLLEQPCAFSAELAALIQIYNQDIALAELHNEITDSERHLDRRHPVLARRCANAALTRIAALKKTEVQSQQLRRYQTRVEAIQDALQDLDMDAPKREHRREGKPRRKKKRLSRRQAAEQAGATS